MTSDSKAVSQTNKISAASLVAIIGFSLFVVWVILVCFWLVHPEDNVREGAVERGAAFVGFLLGYILLGFLGKNPKFNIFDTLPLLCATGCAILLPAANLVFLLLDVTPSWATSISFFLVGAAGALIQVCWLDVFSRFKIEHIAYVLGVSVLVGIIVFMLAASMSIAIQNIAAIISIGASAMLVRYSSASAPGNPEKAPLEATDMKWEHVREIAPSLVMFGMIFSLSFFFLPTQNEDWKMLFGLTGIGLGGVAAILVSRFVKSLNITSVQRLTTTFAVVVCIAMPFSTQEVRLVLTFLMTGACAFLVIENSAFLIDKTCTVHDVPVFRTIPRRLIAFAAGFAAGWVLATAIMLLNISTEVIGGLRLASAVVLIAIMMFFFPVERHHVEPVTTTPTQQPVKSTSPENNGEESERPAPYAPPPGIVMTESEIFEMRCAAIVKLYQLSPREAEILPYLAKGRNNAFLQKQFYISQHTAKSHMYNIYRKLDIHDQQRLMDFVEEFPLDDEREF